MRIPCDDNGAHLVARVKCCGTAAKVGYDRLTIKSLKYEVDLKVGIRQQGFTDKS